MKVRVTYRWRWIDGNIQINQNIKEQTDVMEYPSMKEYIEDMDKANLSPEAAYIEWPIKVEKIND